MWLFVVKQLLARWIASAHDYLA